MKGKCKEESKKVKREVRGEILKKKKEKKNSILSKLSS